MGNNSISPSIPNGADVAIAELDITSLMELLNNINSDIIVLIDLVSVLIGVIVGCFLAIALLKGVFRNV